jgi:hypothetical protein
MRLHKVLWKKHLSLMHFAGHQYQVIHLKDDWGFIKDRYDAEDHLTYTEAMARPDSA